jgi:hypothetical protein
MAKSTHSSANWRANSDQGRALVFSEMNQIRKQGDDGRVSYSSPFLNGFVSVIRSHLNFPPDLEESEAHHIAFDACFASTNDKTINELAYLAEVHRRINQLRQTSVARQFVFLLSIAGDVPFKSIKSLNCRITFEIRQAKWVLENSDKRFTSYRSVRVQSSAYSRHGAAEKAVKSLNLIRGIWNILGSSSMRISSGVPKPVNPILLASSFWEFDKGGEKVEGIEWTLPHDAHLTSLHKIKKLDVMRRNTKKFLFRIQRHPMRGDIEDAVCRYARAYDSASMEDSFLASWSLIEFLTGSDNHKLAAQRSANLFYKDDDLARVIAEHLRTRRNDLVHGDASFYDAEVLAYQAKLFVESLIRFLVFGDERFKNREEFGAYLDLPNSREKLSERRRALASKIKQIDRKSRKRAK